MSYSQSRQVQNHLLKQLPSDIHEYSRYIRVGGSTNNDWFGGAAALGLPLFSWLTVNGLMYGPVESASEILYSGKYNTG